MAPKKKGNKNAQDDWEAELGETIDPTQQQQQQNGSGGEGSTGNADGDGDGGGDGSGDGGGAAGGGGGGGLLATLKKDRSKKVKKGKPVMEFTEDGENDSAAQKSVEVDLAAKAPEEAQMDDEDVFAGTAQLKKAKGGAKGGEKVAKESAEAQQEGEGRIKTKKEKEKEKKEREKQRKKEEVCVQLCCAVFCALLLS